MTTEEKKLNVKYFKLLAEFEKVNRRGKQIKAEMQQIRTRITPLESIIDIRPDEINLKENG